MSSKHHINLVIGAKDSGASKVLHDVKASTVALGVTLGNLASKALVSVINGFRGWVNEALEAEKANVMLDAALRGAGKYSEETARQFRDLANAIQDETGASDESVKANIALLTTLGVTADKMGSAARAVEALKALNYDGAQAARAVALAMEGNIIGFQRLVPELKNAETETEKVEAVNRVLAAGYEQQKANLQTVGGAWAALKGRLGDAREDIIGAVFDGTKLGKTFDEMQAAVGRFLKSDTFTAFTDKLRDGAAYVRQIIEAMGTDGGAKEVGAALGNVILAALKDGADYVGNKIKEAFGQSKRDEFDPRLAGAARFWGAKSGGASWSDALKAMDKPAGGSAGGGGNLGKALDALNAIVSQRAPAGGTGTPVTAPAGGPFASGAPVIDLEAARKRELDAVERKADIEAEKADRAARIASIEAAIEDTANRELQAKNALAALEDARRKAAEQNINDWINDRQGGIDDDAKNKDDQAKADKRAAKLKGKEKRGVKLSEKDKQWLEGYDANVKAKDPEAKQRAEGLALRLALERADLEKQMRDIQKQQLTSLQKIEKSLDKNLEVN